MELRHLRYFLAVANQRNITRASEKLHIAQPSLSRQIQQLEDYLGVALFVRGSRPLELTEAGQYFETQAVQILNQTRNLIDTTRNIGKVQAKFTMGFVGSTLYGYLPEVARRFRKAHPEVDLSLVEMTTLEQINALKAGEIDVGIGRIRHEDPNIRRILLREESLMVALPSDHPLSARETLSLQDLLPETIVLFPQSPRPSFADLVLEAFHDRGLSPQRTIDARELQVSLGLVAAGMGVTILPQSAMGMHRNDVVFRGFDDPRLVSPVLMSIRLEEKSDYVRSLLALVYQMYRDEGIAHSEEVF